MKKNQIKNVLYLCEGSGFAGAESYALSLIKEIVSYKDVNCFVATFYNGPLIQHLQSEPVNLIDLFGRNNLKSICHIVKLVQSKKIDIIHCIDLKSTIIGGVASLFIKGVKTVATIHGLPEHYKNLADQLKYIVSLIIYFLLLRFLFDGKICVSNDLKKRIEKIAGTKKTKVIHNGIELSTEDNSSQLSGSSKKIFTIGTVGRLDTVKGHIYLLEAAQKLLAERDDVVFQIIGDGPLEDHLKERAVNLGVADKVHFLGFRPDAKSLIASVDIFVLPSLHEGIPYVLLEAMASSKPVICTGVGGVNEVVTNSQDGILVSPKDPQALYEAFKELLLKANYRRKLGENARCKIINEFSSCLMTKNTHLIYEKVLND
jgi:L-malate glycosyltransferase